MRRRAAAIYAVFFLAIGVGAYAFMGTTTAPTVSLSGEAFGAGESFTVQERTYTVASVDGAGETGELTWTNDSARHSATLANGSTVSPLTLSWQGQQARWSTRLEAGSDVRFRDGTYRVAVNASAEPSTVTLAHVDNTSLNRTVAVGDRLSFRGNWTTVTSVDAGGATLAWGEPYVVAVPNASDPSKATLRQQFNVSRRLGNDPAVYNETVSVDGTRSVVERATNDTMALSAYLPAADSATVSEGDHLTYEGRTVTVGNITADGVPIYWTGERTNTIRLSEGANVTLAGQPHFVHFADQSSVKILPRAAYDSYQHQREKIDAYQERMNGLWGVTILSLLAAIVLLSLAFLPNK